MTDAECPVRAGTASAGFGLTGMAERVAKMRGQFTLTSQPDQGVISPFKFR